jgi:predicted HTH domain antitoxin
MPVVIPDETLAAAGLTESEAAVEIACWLLDSGKLALWPAAKLDRLSRVEFEGELARRNIAIYRPTPEDFADDLAALERFRVYPE